MPDPDPKSVPAMLEKLLAIYPAEVRDQFRKRIAELHLTNPNDPIFELMIVLGLWGAYYQRIVGNVTKAGADIDASLTDRVRRLQSLAQLIQQTTDKLETIDQEIVKRFPVEWVVERVVEKMDARINTLPLTTFDKKTTDAHVAIDNMNRSVRIGADALASASKEIESASTKITAANLPSVSVGWAVFWLAIGAMLACVIMVGLTTWLAPDAFRVSGWLKYNQGKTSLIVPGHEYNNDTVTRDPNTKAVTFELNP